MGLKNKRGGLIICRIKGEFLVCGVTFFGGGLDFEEGKALFWHWIVPIFKIFRQRLAI